MTNRGDSSALKQAIKAFSSGRNAEAISICEELLRRDKRDVQARHLLGSIELARGAPNTAIRQFEKCIRMSPRDPVLHTDLAGAFAQQGRHDDALKCYDKALRIQRNDPGAIAGKADVYERQGDIDAAVELLRPFIDEKNETIVMAAIWARLSLHTHREQEAIDICRRHVDDPIIGSLIHRQIYSLLGKAHEQLGEYDQAFKAYQRSNEFESPRFDSHSHMRELDLLKQICSSDALSKMPSSKIESPTIIFIVGMPRCGSTLLEQILDAHPDVHGAGETGLIHQTATSLMYDIGAYEPYPECMRALKQANCDQLAQNFIDQISKNAARAQCIVDKSLPNYQHLGLISRLLPNSKIIHCRRDPIDTCLSCYIEVLSTATYPYTGDMRQLGVVYRAYELLMEHWRNVLKMPMHEVQYEQFVTDPERSMREMIAFCDLEWDDACLRYHESKRVVRTASYEQVRRPVYTSSVKRHEKFAAHLKPLREALEMDIL